VEVARRERWKVCVVVMAPRRLWDFLRVKRCVQGVQSCGGGGIVDLNLRFDLRLSLYGSHG